MEKRLKSKTVQLVTIKVDDYVTRKFTWNELWISTRARLNNIFFFFFDCKSRNQHQPVARPGDQENIFSRPRPNVRRPGAVRAQPWPYMLYVLIGNQSPETIHTSLSVIDCINCPFSSLNFLPLSQGDKTVSHFREILN